MTHYSSPEAETRAQDIILSLQAKLEGAGIKSEKNQNWYWFSLTVTEDPEIYRAMTITEGVDKGVLVVSFDTIRMEPDDEILYRGVVMQEDLEDFGQELFEEALRQNSWFKRMQERRAENEQKRREVMASLGRLREDLPEYADLITPMSQTECLFSVRLQGLTEARVRAIVELVGVTQGLNADRLQGVVKIVEALPKEETHA
jgi:hypothetical protein